MLIETAAKSVAKLFQNIKLDKKNDAIIIYGSKRIKYSCKHAITQSCCLELTDKFLFGKKYSALGVTLNLYTNINENKYKNKF